VLPDHEAALSVLLAWLREHTGERGIDAVGHRVVHGGAHSRPELVTPGLLAVLRGLVPLAPDHLPHEITAIEAVANAYPGLPQVACFDTAFHRQMPAVAQRYALPGGAESEGILPCTGGRASIRRWASPPLAGW